MENQLEKIIKNLEKLLKQDFEFINAGRIVIASESKEVNIDIVNKKVTVNFAYHDFNKDKIDELVVKFCIKGEEDPLYEEVLTYYNGRPKQVAVNGWYSGAGGQSYTEYYYDSEYFLEGFRMIDVYEEEPDEQYRIIREELKKYQPELLNRPEIIALTKTEGMDTEIIDFQISKLRKVAGDSQIFAISSSAHQGLKEVLRALRKQVEDFRSLQNEAEDNEEDEDIAIISLSKEDINKAWFVEFNEEEGVYEVFGDKIEKFARRTNFMNVHGVNRLRDILRKMGIEHELRRMGAENSSIISISGNQFELVDSNWED